MNWLKVDRDDSPLIVTFPHTGTELPALIESQLVCPWLARKDTDWYLHDLYDFVASMGATTIRSTISRTVIDLNRDPAGTSLYPGQATTELCPTTTFDGEPLYCSGTEPSPEEIDARRTRWFEPYHAAIDAEVARLREQHPRVLIYDAHSIRSRIPRLFEGELPHFNLGTNFGATCDASITDAVAGTTSKPPFSSVTDGRFRGGWTVRHHGQRGTPVQAIQMELAIRGYLPEPDPPTPDNWPPPYDPVVAAPLRQRLIEIFATLLNAP